MIHRWQKVPVLHPPDGAEGEGRRTCPGDVHSHTYRYHAPGSSFAERCISLSWCSTCRGYTGGMVHVPVGEILPDPLAGLTDERSKLTRSEHRMLDHLDRLIRQAKWPPAQT